MQYSRIKSNGSSTPRTPKLNYILKGIRRIISLTQRKKANHISNYGTPSLCLVKRTGNFKDTMIWAACCLAYFGLLRVSEFTTSFLDCFNSSTDLLLSDVDLDSRTSPMSIQITLKQSKTDQFRTGATIYLGKTTHAICPVTALV